MKYKTVNSGFPSKFSGVARRWLALGGLHLLKHVELCGPTLIRWRYDGGIPPSPNLKGGGWPVDTWAPSPFPSATPGRSISWISGTTSCFSALRSLTSSSGCPTWAGSTWHCSSTWPVRWLRRSLLTVLLSLFYYYIYFYIIKKLIIKLYNCIIHVITCLSSKIPNGTGALSLGLVLTPPDQ